MDRTCWWGSEVFLSRRGMKPKVVVRIATAAVLLLALSAIHAEASKIGGQMGSVDDTQPPTSSSKRHTSRAVVRPRPSPTQPPSSRRPHATRPPATNSNPRHRTSPISVRARPSQRPSRRPPLPTLTRVRSSLTRPHRTYLPPTHGSLASSRPRPASPRPPTRPFPSARPRATSPRLLVSSHFSMPRGRPTGRPTSTPFTPRSRPPTGRPPQRQTPTSAGCGGKASCGINRNSCGCQTSSARAKNTKCMPLLEVLKNVNGVSIVFLKLVQQLLGSDFVSELNVGKSQSGFTVLAPTAKAINRLILTSGDVRSIVNNSDCLKAILRMHIIPRRLTLTELSHGPVTTLQGWNISVLQTNGTSLGFSLQGSGRTQLRTTAQVNIESKNTIVHCVDGVFSLDHVLPSTSQLTVADALDSFPELSNFTWALRKTGMHVHLRNNSQFYSVFAPTNQAFSRSLGNARTSLDALAKEENLRHLAGIVKAHISHKAYTATELIKLQQRDLPLRTMNDQIVAAVAIGTRGAIEISGVPVIETNISAANGAIHKLPELLSFTPALEICPHHQYQAGRWVICSSSTSPYFKTLSCPHGEPKDGIKKCPNDRLCRYRWCVTPAISNSWCCLGFIKSAGKCVPCPGNPVSPCNNHGQCTTRMAGSVTCDCQSGFFGADCSRCAVGKYGPQCKNECKHCDHGMCENTISGNGSCSCDAGWTGELCNQEMHALTQNPSEKTRSHETDELSHERHLGTSKTLKSSSDKHSSVFLIPLGIGAVLGVSIVVACLVLLKMRRRSMATDIVQTSQPTADGSLSITLGNAKSKNPARIIMPPGAPAFVTYQPEAPAAQNIYAIREEDEDAVSMSAVSAAGLMANQQPLATSERDTPKTQRHKRADHG